VQSLQGLVADSSYANATRCGSDPVDKELPSFSAQSIIFDIESAFIRLSPSSHEPLYDWYRSPLAEKIRSAEKSIIDYNSLENFLKTTLYKDSTRYKLIQEIMQNTQTSEFVATLGAEIEYAGIVHSGCIVKATKPGQANREQMLADFTRNDKDLHAKLFIADITAETAYLFRSLTTDELAQYAAFTSEEHARQFYQNLIAAVQHGLKLAGDRISLAQKNNHSAPDL